MKPQENFVMFLEKYPELYSVTQSDLYMEILSLLAKEAKSSLKLGRHFPKVSAEDLEVILKSLISLNLLKKTRAGQKTIYYASERAKVLLDRYSQTKKSFDLG